LSKTKITYYCNNCGAKHDKWQGKCNTCGSWNTIQEEVEVLIKNKVGTSVSKFSSKNSQNQPTLLSDIQETSNVLVPLPDTELNRVLGGGLVKGSVILIGGEPGVGKSTLMLHLCKILDNDTVLYVSGEESSDQIKIRAQRLLVNTQSLFIFTETNLDFILEAQQKTKAQVLIVDSIQTVFSAEIDSTPGSIAQIRHCSSVLHSFAKKEGFTLIIIGHITKDGFIAGPKVLEHLVDVVLEFESLKNQSVRMLRTIKNRFGKTNELGLYEMNEQGLQAILNPSELFLSEENEGTAGVAISPILEGQRSLLVEVQALVCTTFYSTPQRNSNGYDAKRLSMIVAILEKKNGLKLFQKDIFLNITGGIKIIDTAIDLAVFMAILSSSEEVTIKPKICFAAEIGLTGELRSIKDIEKRIQESEKLGYEKIVVASSNKKKKLELQTNNIEIIYIKNTAQVIENISHFCNI
jgi:DNA repair protein RadA/Sms